MAIIYTSNNVDLILLFIIGVLVLEHPKSDGLSLLLKSPILRWTLQPLPFEGGHTCHRPYLWNPYLRPLKYLKINLVNLVNII